MANINQANQLCYYLTLVIVHENGIGILRFYFYLLVCYWYILKSNHLVNQRKEKLPIIKLGLDLTKQLINGFTKRKNKEDKGLDKLYHPVAQRTCLHSFGGNKQKM